MSPVLRRQEEVVVEEPDNWWFSPTAYIVKWSIAGAILLIVFVWFVGGYIHAKRRIKKGLPPMRYHRFLVPQEQRPLPPNGPQNQFSFYQVQDGGYNLNNMPASYNANGDFPATFQGEGKPPINPSQMYDVPPPGPPPGVVSADELPPRQPKASNWAQKINPFHK